MHDGVAKKKKRIWYISLKGFLVAQLVKNLPAMQETPVGFLGLDDLLEKGEAAPSSVLELPRWFSS